MMQEAETAQLACSSDHREFCSRGRWEGEGGAKILGLSLSQPGVGTVDRRKMESHCVVFTTLFRVQAHLDF